MLINLTNPSVGLFEMSIKDPSCGHVFFAASGSAQYARVLREHLMHAEKITLIQRGAEDTSLMSLGLQSVIFSEVFESLDFDRVTPGDINEPYKNIEVSISASATYPVFNFNKMIERPVKQPYNYNKLYCCEQSEEGFPSSLS